MAETKVKQKEVDLTKIMAFDTVRSKIITFNRVGDANTADVSYTGLGFKPSSIIFNTCVGGTSYWSSGFADSAKSGYCNFGNGAGNVYQTSYPISYSNQSAWAQLGAVKSYDADGFTLTWTKVGTPSPGTIGVLAICYR